jgi:hypothetical protein
MLLQSFLRSHFPLLGCPDDLCYVRVVDYSHTDKVTPSKVFAPPAVIQPLTIASAGGLIRRSAQSIFQQVVFLPCSFGFLNLLVLVLLVLLP